jgi:hypothetical protein
MGTTVIDLDGRAVGRRVILTSMPAGGPAQRHTGRLRKIAHRLDDTTGEVTVTLTLETLGGRAKVKGVYGDTAAEVID